MCALKFESSYRLIASPPYPYLLDKKNKMINKKCFFNSANVTLKFGGIIRDRKDFNQKALGTTKLITRIHSLNIKSKSSFFLFSSLHGKSKNFTLEFFKLTWSPSSLCHYEIIYV